MAYNLFYSKKKKSMAVDVNSLLTMEFATENPDCVGN